MSTKKGRPVELESIRQPHNVKVLILAQNKTPLREFYFIKNYIGLIKIDLSYNKLTLFPAGFTFTAFRHLRTLFLHYNKFTTLKNLVVVTQSRSIIYLTLFGNPLEEAKARHFFVNSMSSLMLMDDKIVKVQQRNEWVNINEIDTNPVSFPLVNSPSQEQTVKFLSSVIKELFLVRKYYLKANPIIKIQRWYKKVLRKKYRGWGLTEFTRKQTGDILTIKQQKDELQKLRTQKMQVSRSKQQMVYSLMRMNYDFWCFFKQNIVKGGILIRKEYCLRNNIEFKSSNFYFFRSATNHPYFLINNAKISRCLLFFNYFSTFTILKRINNKNHRKNKRWLVLKHNHKKQKHAYLQNLMSHQKFINLWKRMSLIHEKYQDVFVIPLIDPDKLLSLIKKQYYQSKINKDYHLQNYPFLLNVQMQRVSAVVTIQSWWRGEKARKRHKTIQFLRQREAALKIQKWVRRLRFIHRHKFLLQINNYLKREQTNYIVLEIQQLPAIQQYCTYKQKQGNLFNIPFQENKFHVYKNLGTVASNHASISKVKIVCYCKRRPDLGYLNLSIKTEVQQLAQNQPNSKINNSKVLDILVKQAKQIKRIIDSKGAKYVKFTYQSIEETQNRKFILALKTYRMANHQFIISMNEPKVPQQYITNLYELICQNSMIGILYQNNKPNLENDILKSESSHLQKYMSKSSVKSDVSLLGDYLYMKIKFYHGRDDFSCLMIIKKATIPINEEKIVEKSEIDSFGQEHNFYHHNRRGRLSKRYQQNERGIESLSKISRNVISLHSAQPPKSVRYMNPQSIMNTDQSNSILTSLSPQNSLGQLKIPHKTDNYDKLDKQVYPPSTEVMRQSVKFKRQLQDIETLREKKNKIMEIKMSHIQKLSGNSQSKAESLQTIRKCTALQNDIMMKKIENANNDMKLSKIQKHNKIKDIFKHEKTTFQSQFLQKGNKNIRKQMSEFEKRSKSFKKTLVGSSHKESSDKKMEIFKTQIKQFSINISDGDFGFKNNNDENYQFMKNDISQKIRDNLKRQINSYLSRQQSLGTEYSEIKPEVKQVDEALQRQRKKLKKKRLVHSVFPQEFYPLKQSHAVGFELPKIKK